MLFSQLLFVRLRAAEQALRAGRLDEAYRLGTSPDIANHRRGGAILAELAEKLFERARAHFRADRFTEAMLDLDKAEFGARRAAPGRIGEIAELRQHVQTVACEARRMEDSRRRRLEEARARIDAGSLQAGAALLADAGAVAPQPAYDAEAERLQGDIDRRKDEAAQAAEEAQRMLDAGQVAPAIERIGRARRLHPRSEKVMSLEADVCSRVCEEVRVALAEGRVMRAAQALDSLGELGSENATRRELAEALDTTRAAGAALGRGELDAARQHALRLQHMLPNVEWVRQAAAQLKTAGELVAELKAGPLNATDDGGGAAEGRRRPRSEPALAETVRVGRAVAPRKSREAAPPNGLPERLMMFINGGGSYLLLRGERITLGRAASEQAADIPIISDLAERHAEIARMDDDYFLLSSRDVVVAGRNTRHQLLRDGDRVVLGRQAKFTFRLPSRKSATAALELSDTTRMPGDVRRIVLLRGNATVGFGPSAHISCNNADRAYVLFERAGTLWIRPQGIGPVLTEARAIEMGRTMEMGNLSFVVEPWTARGSGRRV